MGTTELRTNNEQRCRRILGKSELLDTSDLDIDQAIAEAIRLVEERVATV